MQSAAQPLKKLLSAARVKRIPKGQIIIYEGDELDEVFMVKKGVVKLYDIDAQGNEKILHVVTFPSVIPFAFFSGGYPRAKWFYGAHTDCELYVFNPAKLREQMNQDGELAQRLVNYFSQDVHELLIRLSSLSKTVVQDKIVIALRFFVARHSKKRLGGWQRIDFPINHQFIADMVGVTRESTAAAMKELQNKKIIRNPRQTVLEVNRPRLSKLIHEKYIY